MNHNQMLFLVDQKDPSVESFQEEDLFQIGTVAKIQQMVKAGQGVLRVFVEGKYRAMLTDYIELDSVTRARVEELVDYHYPADTATEQAYIVTLTELAENYTSKNPGFMTNSLQKALEEQKLRPIVYELASNVPFPLAKKQEILEQTDVTLQIEMMIRILMEEINVSEIRNEIAAKVKESVDKNQRDYLLREQQKVIREELGEDDIGSDSEEYMEKLAALEASEEIKAKIDKEIRRFKQIPPMAQESSMMRNYIEIMLEMPWDHKTVDNEDIGQATAILDRDHYGLNKVKERVIDYLAVRALKKDGDTPILCLVGPPGTGKTSIARSSATALNKEYIRISLGGVHDEAEIRGHRRTYLGSMPGRIADGIKRAGVKNPLMLLDEIDKTSSDYKGDTASALLEVLDGEQNVSFRDHYLEVPLDLSEVLFIATANEPDRIPKPLLDRMEIIELSSYTENEKYHITNQYLIEKQRIANGIREDQIRIEDDVVYEIIRHYTREAGVRGLERKIGTLMRKAARNVVDKGEGIEVTKENLEEYLGIAPFSDDDKNIENQIGIVRGLAWTSVGGDTLSIEVNVMPGKGRLELTGRMGDVMKESAQIGLSYIRSIADRYEIEAKFFEEHDIHIHIPEGAVPKDGPSAGITMATAMLSAITAMTVRGDVAMTGEITLRGFVLPIGGLKEKLLAAKAAGMKEVLVPAQNKKNVLDLDKEITGGMTITYVKHMDDVLSRAVVK